MVEEYRYICPITQKECIRPLTSEGQQRRPIGLCGSMNSVLSVCKNITQDNIVNILHDRDIEVNETTLIPEDPQTVSVYRVDGDKKLLGMFMNGNFLKY